MELGRRGFIKITGAAVSGQNPGARCLYCSLCSTAWNHSRAICVVCGGSRTLSLSGVEVDSGLARAETCDDCRTCAKVFYEAKAGVDAYADDLTTSEAGGRSS
jgi:FdhE protein